jgi:PAS domain S-box-containing protein
MLVNPLFVRMAAVFVLAATAFVMGLVVVRVLRRRLVEESEIGDDLGPENSDATYPYTAVIQELKQQKFALESEQQVQRRRAKTSEHISAALIANLPCGVLFVGTNGLVKQANTAAKRILGFASPLGMSVAEVFRGAEANPRAEVAGGRVTGLFKNALMQSKGAATQFESSYETPNGNERALDLTLVPMSVAAGQMIGVAAVISDKSERADFQQERERNSEASAEMALELRTSLATIREWAGQMGGADPGQQQSLAGDISAEAERLERVVGGFLAGGREDQALGARA